jgi:hypothetical protein
MEESPAQLILLQLPTPCFHFRISQEPTPHSLNFIPFRCTKHLTATTKDERGHEEEGRKYMSNLIYPVTLQNGTESNKNLKEESWKEFFCYALR